METRYDRIIKARKFLIDNGIDARFWRIDDAKSGMGYPRMYIPAEHREAVRKVVLPAGTKQHGNYIYG